MNLIFVEKTFLRNNICASWYCGIKKIARYRKAILWYDYIAAIYCSTLLCEYVSYAYKGVGGGFSYSKETVSSSYICAKK